ncbi:hypothetical protein TRP8649_02334 [Pelagimonas phthalicica]|uniref:Uncharacterized protein n=1 Tax=Pelagimonas phthalicica TaxID=1037362 RepID=A0A238JCA1_9RHOB|nr:hypothetical protein [Pelagimonas phthalicica]TDS91172.1 hypothetical protein CLV87_2336 [Pelagimonas phthalicica]SMX28219.1 hypothetical protein TRP8649_02334 [Pelagimonas phthalicica]
MSLLQAFEETIAGKEDRAGITAVDVFTSKFFENGHSQQDKLVELQAVVEANLADSERKWFMLTGVIAKWGITSEALSECIRSKLADDAEPMPSMAQYHALRAMGAAAGGLLPVDVLNEHALRQSHPKLWAELVLSAYKNGSPEQITKLMVNLLVGNPPLMPWKSLRALLPEVRLAYGSPAEFRKQIQIIANNLADLTARNGILDAAEKRVGGGISSGAVKISNKTANRKQFNIPTKTIRRDINYGRKFVEPDGQLALATG